MNELTCPTCKKVITVDMEVEYSEYLTEFFCSPDCAKARVFRTDAKFTL